LVDLNQRPPGPEDWSHEESTTYMECDELLRIAISWALAATYKSDANS
jgi:hypothetical protein